MRRLVLTIGTFDILHSGHLNLIRSCRQIAGKEGTVIVGVNSDDFVLRYKKQSPVLNQGERESLLRALRDVDRVYSHKNPQQQYIEQALAIGSFLDVTRFLIIGSDWATKDYFAQLGVTPSFFMDNDILLCYIPYTQGISSTEVKRKVR